MPMEKWVPGDEVLAADFNTMVQDQVINTFPDTATRTTQIPAPKPGQVTYVTATSLFEYWNGAKWTNITPSQDMRIRGATAVATTDGAGWMLVPIGVPPMGSFVSVVAITGDDITPNIITNRISDNVPGQTQLVFRLYFPNGTPFANSVARVNWILMDRP